MNGNRSVTARFDPKTMYTLTVSASGPGTVFSPSGISCGTGGSNCSVTLSADSPVTLNAVADPPGVFDHWGGDCSGNAPSCFLVMDQDKSVSAAFTGPFYARANRAARF